ncbi:putative cell survival pathways protein [Boothiomyces macroporosus]|uniref:Cell survival pathways protein n=1 Tax=Boothiomyces macroporosus TaxID=261099 RepID=A0AAD5UD49_9FUNG|nr:putative cell survival pathways protein [Boothiomyces macroporosus]
MDAELKDLEFSNSVPSAADGPTFYLTTDSGYYILIQMIYSSMNSWSHSIQIACRIHGPNGYKKTKTESKGASDFKMSSDKLSADCKPMSVKYIEVSFDDGDIVMNFQVVSLGTVRIGSGKHLFGKSEDKGYVKSAHIPKAIATGTLKVDGKTIDLKGHGCINFVTQHLPQNVARWNFANLQNETDAVVLYQASMFKGSEKKQISQGFVVLDSKIVGITTENKTVFHHTEFDKFSNYQIPTSLTHEWSGKTLDGKDLKVVMNLSLKGMIDKVDVLSELPYLVRKFIQTFITAPFVYQWLEDVTVDVYVGGEKREIKGRVFHENAFMGDIAEMIYQYSSDNLTCDIRQADIITDTYLAELRAYKPEKLAPIDLPSTFTPPAAPTKPELELAVAQKEEGELKEEEWPALVDPIDDPENYNDEYDFRDDEDHGKLFPAPLKEIHYH